MIFFKSICLFKNLPIYFGLLGLPCCVGFFSSCSKWGLLSSCGAQASHCGGFSYYRAWALENSLSSLVHKLSCSAACVIFWDQGSNLCFLYWQVDSLPLSHQGSPMIFLKELLFKKFYWSIVDLQY